MEKLIIMNQIKNRIDIKKNLPNDYIIVDNPDHPFTFDVPNQLIASKGQLFGIFIPSANEVSNPNRLLKRLAFSRLAFPINLKNIIICDESFINNNEKILFNNFHKVFSDIEILDFTKLVLSKSFETNVYDIEPDIKSFIFRRQSILYRISNNTFTLGKKTFHEIELQSKYSGVISWETFEKIQSPIKNIYQSENILLYSKKIDNNKSFNKNLENAFTFSSLIDYNLDNGVPIPNYNTFNVLSKFMNINEIPLFKTDPLKSIRAITFAGWFPITTNEYEDIEIANKKIQLTIDQEKYNGKRYKKKKT
jgi:hypothetical protein